METLVVLFVSICAFKVLFIKVLWEEPRQIVVSLFQNHWILRAHSDPHIKIRINSLISSWDLTTTRWLWHRAKGAYTASDEWGQWWRMFQRASYCRAYLQISKKYLHVDSQMLTRHLKQTPFLKLWTVVLNHFLQHGYSAIHLRAKKCSTKNFISQLLWKSEINWGEHNQFVFGFCKEVKQQ